MTNQHRKEGMFLNADSSQDQREPPKGKGMLPHRRKSWHRWAIALGVLFLLGALGGNYSEDGVSFVSKISFSGPSVSAAGSRADSKRQPRFLPNSFRFWDNPRNMPTSFGPAYADIVLEPQNFLPCRGGPFALCFYSGPEPASTSDPDLSCTVTEDGQFASCNCFEIPYGTYFVDINSILNSSVYKKTVRECGEDGSDCFLRINKAPVCDAINQGKFMPNAEMISTFSLNCAIEVPIGQTDCPMEGPFLPYAGCMTASCIGTEVEGIVDCLCPIFTGPYQVGQTLSPSMGPQCDLGPDLVWSAAFNPNANGGGVTFPTDLGSSSHCTPDIPESFGGCPLLEGPPSPPPPPSIERCQKVCKEYQDCQGAGGVKLGLTCDATLCTSTCTDRGLLGEACSGLQKCETSEIIKLETEFECSCCASQLCDCGVDPDFFNDATQAAIFDLNQEQWCESGIMPQCCLNGTLCGENPEDGMPFSCESSSCPSGS